MYGAEIFQKYCLTAKEEDADQAIVRVRNVSFVIAILFQSLFL